MCSGRLFSKIGMSLFLGSMIFSVGCTRPEGDTSTIKIVVPQAMTSQKNAAQAPSSTDKLAHVVINVTGDGIGQPILVVWDGHEGSGTVAPPSSFNLSVPMGSNRLFQVLAVYKDSTTNLMTFYYGDQVKTLSQASESVTVPIASFSSGALGGNVFGRYLDTANSGPSGVVQIRMDPGNGKPPLLIDRTLIHNGWFSIFMLTGTPFQYVLESGRMLFGGAVSLDDARFKPAANDPTTLRVTLPSHQRHNNSWESEEAEILVYGWFADPTQASVLSSKAICRPSTLSTLTKLAKFDNNSTYLSGVLDGTLPTSDALLKTDASSLGQYYVNGGVLATSDSRCLGPKVIYDDFLAFAPLMIDGNGKDGAAPFQIPFRKDNSGKVFTISTGAADRTIQMQLLPNLVPGIESVKIFKKVTTEEMHDDSIDCLAIASGLMSGFVEAGSGNPDGSGAITVTTNITSAEATSGVNAAACPVIGGKLAPLGALINKWQFSSNNGGNPVPADSYQLNLAFGNLVPGQCHNARIELKGSGSFNVTNASNHTFNLAVSGVTGASLALYANTDTTCSSPLGSSVSLNAPDTFKEFRIKLVGGSAPSNPQINVTTSSFGSMAYSMPFMFATSYGSAIKLAAKMDNSPSNAGFCQALDIYQVDPWGFPVPAASNLTLSGVSTPGGDITTYGDAGCATPVGSFAFNSGDFAKRVWIKRTAGTGEASMTFSLSDGMTGYTFYFDPVSYVDHVKVLAAYNLGSSPFIGISDCLPVYVQGFNNSDTPIGGSIGGSFNLPISTMNGGMFYTTQSNCYSNTSGSTQYSATLGPASAASTIFWYRNPGGGTSLSIGLNQPHFRIFNGAANVAYAISTIPSLAPDFAPFSTPAAWFDVSSYVNMGNGAPVAPWTAHNSGVQFSDVSTSGMPQVSTTFGGPWKSVAFSGSAGTGTALSSTGLSLPGDFTIAMRIRFNSVGTTEGFMQLIGSLCNGSTYTCRLIKAADGSVSFFGMSTSPSAISDTNFHTLMFVRSSGTFKIYIDSNSPALSTPNANSEYNESYNTIKFGYTMQAGAPTDSFNGNVSDIVIYNSDQSSGFLQMHNYLQQKTPP